jgi:hypothetical protein
MHLGVQAALAAQACGYLVEYHISNHWVKSAEDHKAGDSGLDGVLLSLNPPWLGGDLVVSV